MYLGGQAPLVRQAYLANQTQKCTYGRRGESNFGIEADCACDLAMRPPREPFYNKKYSKFGTAHFPKAPTVLKSTWYKRLASAFASCLRMNRTSIEASISTVDAGRHRVFPDHFFYANFPTRIILIMFENFNRLQYDYVSTVALVSIWTRESSRPSTRSRCVTLRISNS